MAASDQPTHGPANLFLHLIMGCAPSKLLKQQSGVAKEWVSDSAHNVVLKSSTYGLLKIEAKPIEPCRKGSHMMGVRKVIQKSKSVKSVRFITDNSASPPTQRHHTMIMETIDVADMMKGLDEEEFMSLETADDGQEQYERELGRYQAIAHGNMAQALRSQGIKRVDPLSGEVHTSCMSHQAQNSSFNRAFSGGHLKISVNVEFEKNICQRSCVLQENTWAPARFLTQENPLGMQVKLFTGNTKGPSSTSQDALTTAHAVLETETPFFDPELLASLEEDLATIPKEEWDSVYAVGASMSTELPTVAMDEEVPQNSPLDAFEMKCPPGSEDTVVLYTTSLRGIRKTFEDCHEMRTILQSLGIGVDERDVSMHMVFRNELEDLMGQQRVLVPRLFIKGRYIGGAQEVSQLHEEGRLAELVKGLPMEPYIGISSKCDGCGGIRFIPCLQCSGSCKILSDESHEILRCTDCNENGLIHCPVCTQYSLT